jgi:AcrR family transcriptional regulator
MSAEETLDRRPGRPRDGRVDVSVVDATLAEIADKGFAGVTIEGIAGRAGVGKATIYRRWQNKEELLHFVARQVSDVCAVPDTGTVRDDLRAICEPMGEVLGGSIVGALLPELIAEAARSDEIRALMHALVEERRVPALRVVRRAMERGELPAEVDPHTFVDLICGAVVYRRVVLGVSVARADIRHIIDQALVGLSA